MVRSWFLVVCIALAASCSNREAAKKAHFDRGNQYFSEQKYKEAVIEFRNVVELDPMSGEARLKLAESYLRADDYSNAVRQFIRAADLLPADSNTQLKAGMGLLLAGQFEDAVSRANGVLSREPRNLKAQLLLGNALAGLEDFDGAVKQLKEAIELDPTMSGAYTNLGYVEKSKGSQAEAQAAFEKAVEIDPKSPDAKISLGDFYWSVGRMADAERTFAQAVALDPKSIAANRRLAVLYVSSGRAPLAEPFVRVIADESNNRFELADYYASTGRAKDAISVLEKIARGTDLAGTDAQVRLAALDAQAGRTDLALRSVQAVLVRAPNHVNALILKGRLLSIGGKPREALAALKLAIAADPRSLNAYLTLGGIHRSLNDEEQAIVAYTEARRLNPRATTALIELANLFLARGGTAAAVQYAEQALRNDPVSQTARLVLARCLIMQGETARAGSELRALEAIRPNLPALHVQKGALALLNKDRAGAARSFSRALALDPNSLEALAGLVSVDLAGQRVGDARTRVEARLARTPNDAGVLVLAAKVYQFARDLPRSEQALRKAMTADPTNLEAYQLLGQLLMRQGRLDSAQVELEALARVDPKSVGTATALAVVLELRKSPEAATKQYERVLQIDPRAPIASNNLAWMYADAGVSLDLALQLAQTAKAGLPGRPEVADTLGWVLYKKGEWVLATAQFKEASGKDPNNALYHYHLGLAMAKNVDLAGARQHLGLALKLRPNFDGADEARRVLGTIKSK